VVVKVVAMVVVVVGGETTAMVVDLTGTMGVVNAQDLTKPRKTDTYLLFAIVCTMNRNSLV
jgi:hypothetical protein